MKRYSYHPACLLFPRLGKKELQELADDIKERGLLNPIILYQGKILDGRNRFAACKLAGVKPRFIKWTKKGNPVEWVISQNLFRRHLTSSQRAVVACDILPLLEKEAKERQRQSKGRGKKVGKNLPTLNGKSTQIAARIAKTNEVYVKHVKSINSTAPELIEHIRSGSLRITDAKELSRLRKPRRKKVVRLLLENPEKKVQRIIREVEIDTIKKSKAKGVKTNNGKVKDKFVKSGKIVLEHGDCRNVLSRCPDDFFNLIITSPPYNTGKEYEKKTELSKYLDGMKPIIEEIVRVLSPNGSLCWQVGHCIENREVFPLDIFFYPIIKDLGLKLRSRIIWTFGSGRHCAKRFSGRYETLLWFTKTDNYVFNLDNIRIPALYPAKKFSRHSPKHGLPSGNPKGKNPEDVWQLMVEDWESGLWNIPNVKSHHPEKTIHPCQFPIELVERCILSMTDEDDWVLDPFSGVGSAMLAAVKHGRRTMGIERKKMYINEARRRMNMFFKGELPYRPLCKPVRVPK